MKKITVYGSLLKGLGNHRFLKTSKLLISENLTLPYTMIGFGRSFPGLVKNSEENKIYTETYEVTDVVYRNIESLEGYPNFYNRAPLKTGVGDSEIYFIEDHNGVPSIPKINNIFNWKKHLANA